MTAQSMDWAQPGARGFLRANGGQVTPVVIERLTATQIVTKMDGRALEVRFSRKDGTKVGDAWDRLLPASDPDCLRRFREQVAKGACLRIVEMIRTAPAPRGGGWSGEALLRAVRKYADDRLSRLPGAPSEDEA